MLLLQPPWKWTISELRWLMGSDEQRMCFHASLLIDIHQLDTIQAPHLTPKSHVPILAHLNCEVYSLYPSFWKAWLSRVDFLSEPRRLLEWADVVVDRRLRSHPHLLDLQKPGNRHYCFVVVGGKCLINCAVCYSWFHQYASNRLH